MKLKLKLKELKLKELKLKEANQSQSQLAKNGLVIAKKNAIVIVIVINININVGLLIQNSIVIDGFFLNTSRRMLTKYIERNIKYI